MHTYMHAYISFSIFPGDRLFDFDVFLNNLSFDAAKKNRGNKLCMYHKNQVRQGATETLRCKKPTKARYVKIQVRGIRMLTLCEVEVYDLKGKGKNAYVINYIMSWCSVFAKLRKHECKNESMDEQRFIGTSMKKNAI